MTISQAISAIMQAQTDMLLYPSAERKARFRDEVERVIGELVVGEPLQMFSTSGPVDGTLIPLENTSGYPPLKRKD